MLTAGTPTRSSSCPRCNWTQRPKIGQVFLSTLALRSHDMNRDIPGAPAPTDWCGNPCIWPAARWCASAAAAFSGPPPSPVAPARRSYAETRRSGSPSIVVPWLASGPDPLPRFPWIGSTGRIGSLPTEPAPAEAEAHWRVIDNDGWFRSTIPRRWARLMDRTSPTRNPGPPSAVRFPGTGRRSRRRRYWPSALARC